MNDTDFQSPPVVPPSPFSSTATQPMAAGTTQEGNGLAIASMVLGMASFVFLGPLCAIPAIILGHMSLGKIRRGAMSVDSRGLAMAGTILGYINLALFILAMAAFVAFVLLSARGAGHVSPFVYAL